MVGITINYPNDYVWHIVDKNTRFATICKKSIRELTIYEIEAIDKKGYYYSTEEKAKEALNKTTV